MSGLIHPGDAVKVRDAYDVWHEAFATSSIEGKYHRGLRHDFPIMWIVIDSPGSQPIPWPIEDVKPSRRKVPRPEL